MKGRNHSAFSRREKLREVVDRIAHLLPAQGPIGVFVHHNTLHAFEHLPFERAVIEASQLFGTEPYMPEAAYRKELARGRIHIDDINAVLESEPDEVVFPGLTRRSLRRAMITPGVREFDGATVLWRTEQGDLARDFRQPALRTLFDACFKRTVAHEEEPPSPRPIDEIIHPWLIRLCSVFLDQGTAYWPMPYREKGFYESVRILLANAVACSRDTCGASTKSSGGSRSVLSPRRMRCSIISTPRTWRRANGKRFSGQNCSPCPAGLG